MAASARRSFGRPVASLSGELKEAIMRHYLPASLTGIGFATMLYSGALAQQAPAISPYAFERGFPTQEGAQRAQDDADYQRAVTAYRFWYPTVSMEGTFQGTRDAGVEDNKAAMIMAAGPRHVIFTANSDTPYMGATLNLKQAGPMGHRAAGRAISRRHQRSSLPLRQRPGPSR